MLHALAELNQFLPAVSKATSSGDVAYDFPDKEALEWWQTATCQKQPYLLPDSQTPARTVADYPNLENEHDFIEDLKTSLNIVHNAGLEMLVLDHTRPILECLFRA